MYMVYRGMYLLCGDEGLKEAVSNILAKKPDGVAPENNYLCPSKVTARIQEAPGPKPTDNPPIFGVEDVPLSRPGRPYRGGTSRATPNRGSRLGKATPTSSNTRRDDTPSASSTVQTPTKTKMEQDWEEELAVYEGKPLMEEKTGFAAAIQDASITAINYTLGTRELMNDADNALATTIESLRAQHVELGRRIRDLEALQAARKTERHSLLMAPAKYLSELKDQGFGKEADKIKAQFQAKKPDET